MPNLGDMIVRIVGDNAQFDSSVDKSQKKMESFATAAERFGKRMTAFVTTPIIGLGVAAVKATADLEVQQAAFETMLGSAERATDMLKNLRDFAAKTPFQLSDLTNASKTLLSFGYDATRVLPTIKNLGDVAQGNAQRFQALTLAFAQTQSVGRLMGQDLLQMINAGFNPLQQIATTTGKTMAELKAEMEKGAISADMVAAAFESATAEGGRFAGGMERASTTLSGRLSTLWDTITEVRRAFGDELAPMVARATIRLTEFAQKITGLDSGAKRTIITIAGVVAAIGPLALGISLVTKAVIALQAAAAFLAANPLVLVLAGVAALAVGLGVLATKYNRAREEQQRFAQGMEDEIELSEKLMLARQAEGLQLEITKKKEQIARIEALGTARGAAEALRVETGLLAALEAALAGVVEKQRVLNETQSAADAVATDEARQKRADEAYAAIAKGLTTITEKSQLAIQTGDEYDVQLERRKLIVEELNGLIEDGFAFESGAVTWILDNYPEVILLEEERLILTERQQAARAAYVEEEVGGGDRIIGSLKDVERIRAEVRKKQKDDHDKEVAELEETRRMYLGLGAAAVGAVQAISSAIQAATDRRIAEVDRELQATLAARGLAEETTIESLQRQLAAAKEEGDQELIAELNNAIARERIIQEFEEKKAAIAYKGALAQWRLDVLSGLGSAALAVLNGLLTKPFVPAGIIAGALAGVAGLAQVAAIKAAKPVPQLAAGGIAMPRAGGVDVNVAEAGVPEAILPLDRLEEVLARWPGGSEITDERPVHLVVNMNSRPFLDTIFDATRNRTVIIDAGAVV